MGISRYLAMTKGEMAHFSCPDGYFPGWMACHFSPYGTGLSNFPRHLPPDSMLILNDRTPICGHDAVLIKQQLQEAVELLGCSCVLLDFQRPEEPETARLCAVLAEGLPCPVGISEVYARETAGPVFLPPVPVNCRLQDHFAPWEGREIWLEIAPEAIQVTVTASASIAQPLPSVPAAEGFFDDTLYCRYRSEVAEAEIRFTLWRDSAALEALTDAAAILGVTKAVGLYQDFKNAPLPENAKKHPAE